VSEATGGGARIVGGVRWCAGTLGLTYLKPRYAKLPDPMLYWWRLLAQAIVGEVDKKPNLAVSWDALLEQWKRIKQPTVIHAATIRLLREHFGERDCRQVNPRKIASFATC
jgi:hypothetical protein